MPGRAGWLLGCPGDPPALGDPSQRRPPESTLPAKAWLKLGTEASPAASGPSPALPRGARGSASCQSRACGPAAHCPGTKLHLVGQSARPWLQGRFGACLVYLRPHHRLHCLSPASSCLRGMGPHLLVDPLVLGEVPVCPQLKVENHLPQHSGAKWEATSWSPREGICRWSDGAAGAQPAAPHASHGLSMLCPAGRPLLSPSDLAQGAFTLPYPPPQLLPGSCRQEYSVGRRCPAGRSPSCRALD